MSDNITTTDTNSVNIKELTKDVKDALWAKYGSKMKYVFGRMLTMYKHGIEYDKNQPDELVDWYTTPNDKGTCSLLQFSRLMIGYNGIGINLTPTRCNLISEQAMSTDSDKCTADHFLGVTQVASETVFNGAFEECGWDVDYMVNEWLYDHLHYWFTIKITKEEHKQENLARNKHSIEDKENFVHYNEPDKPIKVLLMKENKK